MKPFIRRCRQALLSAWIVLVLQTGVSAAAAIEFGKPVGRGQAAVDVSDAHGCTIRFAPDAWPNAYWSAGKNKTWDWRDRTVFAFKVTNVSQTQVDFYVRVDYDPSADGRRHCVTGGSSLAPGKSGTYFLDISPQNSPLERHGMRGGPPLSGAAGLTPLTGYGEIDPSHVVGFQIFVHNPPCPQTLRISGLRLLPSISDDQRYDNIVDAYGQYTRANWPGKVHTASGLSKAYAAEKKELASAPAIADRDLYGGWSKGPLLTATGFFRTVKQAGRWWLVTPGGRLFFSVGIDCVQPGIETIVEGRESMFTWLPPPGDPLANHYGTTSHVLYGPIKSGRTFDFYAANLQRRYGPDDRDAWRSTALARLRAWGFNTIGNWSDETLERRRQIPYVETVWIGGAHAVVSSGSDYWGQMHDPFDPQFATDVDAAVKAKAAQVKEDPWCIGYFVDNELSWGGEGPDRQRYGLAYGALSAAVGSPAKLALLAQLQARYGEIGNLNTAWGTALPSWDILKMPYALSDSLNKAQKADMAAFVTRFATQYFTVVRAALHQYDPNHLYLGCRFAGRTPEAVQAAAKICDVVSFNIYARTIHTPEWDFTKTLGKPCIIGEFHFGALDRGLFHAGLVPMPSQAARAQSYQIYMNAVLDNPAFVGAHWFQYVDEPLTGRSLDGENYNIGFVTVTDLPYPELTAAARKVHSGLYARRTKP